MRGPVFREVQSSSFEEPNIELSLRSFRGCRWQARQVRQPFQEGSGHACRGIRAGHAGRPQARRCRLRHCAARRRRHADIRPRRGWQQRRCAADVGDHLCNRGKRPAETARMSLRHNPETKFYSREKLPKESRRIVPIAALEPPIWSGALGMRPAQKETIS